MANTVSERPTRVLLIEDNPGDARLLQEALRGASSFLTVEHVQRLSDGLSRLSHSEFDVVLLDLTLPDSHDIDTVNRVREHAPRVPIVVVTGADEKQLGIRSVQAGAQDYLVKDHIDGEAIVHAVRFAIERKQTEQALHVLNDTLQQRTTDLGRANADLDSVATELRKANERLEQLAEIEPLTELLNRRGLQQALSQETQRVRREGSTLCALLVDLDDFKRINDTLGHAVGDQALVQIAHKLKASLRATDHAARIGGDEFLILLPGVRLAEGVRIAEKLRLAVSGTAIVFSPTSSIAVTASVGLVQVSEATASIAELLSQAESVLQRSKRAGKDQVSYDEGAGAAQAAAERDVLPSTLRRGDGFHAVSQPIFSLDEMRPVGYELLSRLRIKAFEMPDDFFRISIQANLLTLVDHYCLRTCLAASTSLPPDARRHLNLFPSTIMNIPVQQLLNELQGNGRTGATCIEISEQQVLGDPGHLAEALRVFQQADVLVAIDDIGFGRSSLESLILLQPQIV